MTPRRRRSFGHVRKLPSGRFQASYLDPSGLRRVAPSTFSTKSDATVWLATKQSELHQGVWRDPAIGRITLSYSGLSQVRVLPGRSRYQPQ